MTNTELIQTIIRCALLYEHAFVCGGYVRDVIIRKCSTFDDIDIVFDKYEDRLHFVQLMYIFYKNIHLSSPTSCEFFGTIQATRVEMKVEGISLDLFVRTPQNTFVSGMLVVKDLTIIDVNNFTCNAFTLTSSGLKLSGKSVFFESWNDCDTKTFSVTELNREAEYHTHAMSLIDSASKLVRNEWTMKKRPDAFLIKQTEVDCSICMTIKEDLAITTTCNHTFCVSCFQKANEHRIQCPICRTEKCV